MAVPDRPAERRYAPRPARPGDPLRVAVVGVGHLGRVHARIWAEHPDAELVAVVDADAARAAQVAGELGCAALADPAELPAELDAVSVVVPTARHAEVAVPLLERGLACLVEKPLAADLEQADAILEAARAAGVQLAVGHVERFQPGLRKVREMGIVPRFIECHRLAPFGLRALDVGVVHDLMIHDLDLVLDLVGSEVESFDAAGGSILSESEDLASVRLVFANGARANVTASRASLKPMRRFRMFGADGYVSLDFHENYGLIVKKGPSWETGRGELATADPSSLAGRLDLLTRGILQAVELKLDEEQRPLQAELDAFLRCLAEGTEPVVSGEAGRRALELAERITARIRTQAW